MHATWKTGSWWLRSNQNGRVESVFNFYMSYEGIGIPDGHCDGPNDGQYLDDQSDCEHADQKSEQEESQLSGETNLEKLAVERGQDLCVVKLAMVSLVHNWNKAADANDRVAEQHDRLYGTDSREYVEYREHASTLRSCAEHLAATMEHF